MNKHGENKMIDGRYVAIDIGTVTCRMMIADVCAGQIHVLAKEYRITNLGEGVDATHILTSQAMQRVKAALTDFLAIRENFDTPENPVRQTMVVATSAARDAENAAEFYDMLAGLGLQLQVISGEEEAALTFAGATSRFVHQHVMVVDVGGGSTEISIGLAGEKPKFSHSFNVGCRRATERFLLSDPPAPSEIEAARAWMSNEFCDWFRNVQACICQPLDQMIAVAGTATTAVSIREAMREYDSSRVDMACVTLAQLREITTRLQALPLQERQQVVGLDPNRAPVIVAGMLILEEVMHAARQTAFTVSESDILSGIVIRCANAA